MVFTDSGRSLCLTATLRSGEQLHLLNVYQFTAAHNAMQSQLWERLTAWIRKHSAEKILLLGDLNSTMPEALITRRLSGKTSADIALEGVRNTPMKASRHFCSLGVQFGQ